ncbi:MAG: M23 family metallopeptidase [Pseudomonadota bacterium]
MMGGVILFAVVLFASIIAMFGYRGAYLGTEDVRVKAARHMQERATIINKLGELEQAIARTERFAAKIEASTSAGTTGRVGEGPVAEQDALPEVSTAAPQSLSKGIWKSPFSGSLTKGLSLALDKLSERSGLVEEKLHTLFSKQQDKLYFWASLPSKWPARGWITSVFGSKRGWGGRSRIHEGIDIAAPRGTPVVAPGDGIVTYTGYQGGYGKTIMIDHGYGISTRYAHCSMLYVDEGQRVKRGSLIASIGNTGRSTGPHLHYEVHVDGVPIDPMLYLASNM